MIDQKVKSLHSITIDSCQIRTQLFYNINTNHIGISNAFNYQKIYNGNYKNKRKIYSDSHKKEMKVYQKIYYESNKDPNMSIMGSKEYRIKCSCSHQGIEVEEFDGFITESPYCEKFNESCKEKNREKYGRECFICGKFESKNITTTGKLRKLSVHHVDMNKNQGCDSNWKLVPLCMVCHSRAHNDLWQSRIEYLLNDLQKPLYSMKNKDKLYKTLKTEKNYGKTKS